MAKDYWKPIENAPKEEQPILLSFDRGRYGDVRKAPVIGFWRDDAEGTGWHHWSHRDKIIDRPVAWRELPSPPSE